MNYQVFASGHTGLTPVFTVRENGKSNRAMDPNNDIYPPPLMSSSPAVKCNGFNKITFAIWYMQPERLKYHIEKHQDDYLRMKPEDILSEHVILEQAINIRKTHDYGWSDYDNVDAGLIDIYQSTPYGNIINMLCSASFPSDIPHDHNELLFDRMFMTVLKTLKPENIPEMLRANDKNSAFTNNAWNHICDESYIYSLILLNYGAQFRDDSERKAFIGRLKDDHMKAFYLSEQLDKIVKSDLPIGQKLKAVCDGICPITLENITQPVIIEDGSVYEKKAILNWFNQGNNTSPVTGTQLKKFWIMYDINANEIIYADNKQLFPKNIQNYIK